MINLKEVDGVKIESKHIAQCHCGAVELDLTLPDGLVDIRRCDCSMCRRRGAIAASVPLSGISIRKGYFCADCGIYTHHQRRSNPSQYGFNVSCLVGINPLKIDNIPTHDGVNHSADR
jgi:hypothetical protein